LWTLINDVQKIRDTPKITGMITRDLSRTKNSIIDPHNKPANYMVSGIV